MKHCEPNRDRKSGDHVWPLRDAWGMTWAERQQERVEREHFDKLQNLSPLIAGPTLEELRVRALKGPGGFKKDPLQHYMELVRQAQEE